MQLAPLQRPPGRPQRPRRRRRPWLQRPPGPRLAWPPRPPGRQRVPRPLQPHHLPPRPPHPSRLPLPHPLCGPRFQSRRLRRPRFQSRRPRLSSQSRHRWPLSYNPRRQHQLQHLSQPLPRSRRLPLRPCSQSQLRWHNQRRPHLSLFLQLSSLNRDSCYLGNRVNHSNQDSQVSRDSHCPGNHQYLGSNFPAKFRGNKCLASHWLQVSLKQVFRFRRAGRRAHPSLQRLACQTMYHLAPCPPAGCHPAGFHPAASPLARSHLEVCLRQACHPEWEWRQGLVVCLQEVFLPLAAFRPPAFRRPTVFHLAWFHQEVFHLAECPWEACRLAVFLVSPPASWGPSPCREPCPPSSQPGPKDNNSACPELWPRAACIRPSRPAEVLAAPEDAGFAGREHLGREHLGHECGVPDRGRAWDQRVPGCPDRRECPGHTRIRPCKVSSLYYVSRCLELGIPFKLLMASPTKKKKPQCRNLRFFGSALPQVYLLLLSNLFLTPSRCDRKVSNTALMLNS